MSQNNSSNNTPPHLLNMVSNNLQGKFKNKIKEIKHYLEETKPHLLGLQETKLYQEDIRHIKVPGYEVYACSLSKKQVAKMANGKQPTVKRGVMLLIRKDLARHVITHKSSYEYNGRIQWIKMQIKDTKIIIFNVYAPNKEQEQKKFQDQLTQIIQKRKEKNPKARIITMGDWNAIQKEEDTIGKPNKKKIEQINQFKTKNKLTDPCQKRSKYTWTQLRKGKLSATKIDYFLMNKKAIQLATTTSYPSPITQSDHSPIQIGLRIPLPERENKAVRQPKPFQAIKEEAVRKEYNKKLKEYLTQMPIQEAVLTAAKEASPNIPIPPREQKVQNIEKNKNLKRIRLILKLKRTLLKPEQPSPNKMQRQWEKVSNFLRIPPIGENNQNLMEVLKRELNKRGKGYKKNS